MRRRFVAAAVALAIAASVRAQTRGAVDWIFLVDTSKSMRGVGGTKDIFADVQGSIQSFVREANDGDSVTVITFDRDVSSPGLRDINGEFDRKELFENIRNLEANGNRTHLGAAIAKGLDRAEAAVQRNPDRTRERAIVLFTDGKEDVRGIEHPVSIPSNVERAQQLAPWIFFVSMGEHEGKLDDFVKATKRSRVLRAQDREAIRSVAQDIRSLVAPKAPPPPPLTVSATPSSIDLGAIEAGERSAIHEVTISANRNVSLAVQLIESAGVSMERRDDVQVAPNAPARVRLQFEVAHDAAIGPRTLTVRIGNNASVTAQTTITAPPLGWRIAKWAGAIALLLLLALIGFVLYSGKMPGELLSAVANRNTLEGEIEIVKPPVAADATFVGLPALRAKDVALSAIVPPEALDGNDARLFCRRERGQKKVWIAADQGTLRVNDIEVPMSELYDADTIRIGQATLRFNRIGYDRPQEDHS